VWIAGARRWAGQLHRERLDGSGGPYLEHLARVAEAVAAGGGSPTLQMAAWLHGTPAVGLAPADLVVRGVPAEVAAIVDTATRRPWEPTAQWAIRIKASPGAFAVVIADWLDECRPEALSQLDHEVAERRVRATVSMLDSLGLPLPDHLAQPTPSTRRGVGRLASWDPGRWAAVERAGELGDLRAAHALLKAYRKASRGSLAWASGRWTLSRALWQIASHQRHLADPGWVVTLERLTTDTDPWLRVLGLTGLRGSPDHQPVLVRALDDPDPSVVQAAIHGVEPAHADQLLATFIRIRDRDERGWDQVRREIIRALARMGDPRIWPEVVRAGESLLNLNVASQLVKLGDRSLTPQLIQLLRTGEHRRLDGVVFVLGEWQVLEAVPDLVSLIERSDVGAWVAGQAVEALGKLAVAEASPALAAVAERDDPTLRTAALRALAMVDPGRAEEAALRATQDFHPEVRELAIRILSRIGTTKSTAALAAACDGTLVDVALKGLTRLGDPRAMPTVRNVFLTATERRRLHLAGRALVNCADGRSPSLYLSGTSDIFRLRASAWVLGQVAGPAALPLLAGGLDHPDGILRARCAAALGRVGSADAIVALQPALRDPIPRVRANAATAVGRAGAALVGSDVDLAALNTVLAPGLEDSHPDVRQATHAALRRLTSVYAPHPPEGGARVIEPGDD
jgi:HEAT repeat protein